MCENVSNILQVKFILNVSCHLQYEEIMKMCSTHVTVALPANMAPQIKQTLPTTTEHGPVRKRAPSPGLVCSFKTMMFLQNVES